MLSTQTTMSHDYSFHTQGPLPPDAKHLYVVRADDDALRRLINQRDYVALIGPRLSGKSSMLLRQWALLKESPRHVPVYISLGQFSGLDESDWYAHIHQYITRQTDGLLPVPAAPALHALALQEEIIDALEGSLSGKTLVIMLDQVETTPLKLATAFFSTLREMYVNRWMRPALHNVIFVLAGRFIPDELIKDPAISPFRVTEIIYLEDADLEGITHLIASLGTDRRQLSNDVPERIFEWTEGDVYLTHKLCAGLARDIPEGAILLADVDRAARRHLYEDDIFRKMWRRISGDQDMIDLIKTLLEHREPVRFTLLQHHLMDAWLEGAIKSDSYGYCVMRSLVHESVFYSMQRTRNGSNKTPRRVHAITLNGDDEPLRGRYRLDHVLHPGMTSYVYRATDFDTGETVAIKQLMVSRDLNEMAWHRFQRESEALKHLEHPHIVRFLDSFSEGEFEYIVMEYIYGGSLFERMNREGRLSLAKTVDIAIKLASALQHAHERGIIHRDVKPSNTMLTPDYSPRLADFGVARLNYHTRVTLPHTVIGTTPYLSPEGCLGENIDARGDIWALGVMLYEMLAGTLPFVGRTDDIIARAILEEDPPNIRAIRPDTPEELVNVINHMLEKTMYRRTPSAQAVVEALMPILQQLKSTEP
ncbi:MAG: serine/threonine protein kinase [Anaerolineae bacterium]|nr:serine/threonine protein kinase [Anaerolineae bacterium]